MKFILVIGVLFIFSSNLFCQDSTMFVPYQKIGLNFMYENISNKSFDENRGTGLELGVFYEKKILERVHILGGANIVYENLDDMKYQVERNENSDTTTILRLFEVEAEFLSISIPLAFKFYYFNKPKIYFLTELATQVKLSEKQNSQYVKTDYRGPLAQFIGDNIETDPLIKPFDFKNVNFDFKVGSGIELNRINFELLIISNFTFRTAGIGGRLKVYL